MALYVDTSCLLKLLWEEPESAPTVEVLRAESVAVVSDLTWLETKVRIQGMRAAGTVTRKDARELLVVAEDLVVRPPFERRAVPPEVFARAARDVVVDAGRLYCRTLDRLHLAAIRGLGLTRLLTHDAAQARAARGLGLTVVRVR